MDAANGKQTTSFTDSAGDTWNVECTYASLRRVYLRIGLHLEDLFRPDTDSQKKVADDPFLLTDVLCVLLESQLEKRNLSVDDFASRFKSRAQVEASIACLLRAVSLFSQPGDRAWLPTALDKHFQAIDKLMLEGNQAAMEAVESTDWDEVAKRTIASLSASSLPESAESIPDLSLSGSSS